MNYEERPIQVLDHRRPDGRLLKAAANLPDREHEQKHDQCRRRKHCSPVVRNIATFDELPAHHKEKESHRIDYRNQIRKELYCGSFEFRDRYQASKRPNDESIAKDAEDTRHLPGMRACV